MNWTEKYSRLCDLVREADGKRTRDDIVLAMQDAGWRVSKRQVERDITDLKELGIVIWFDHDAERYTVTLTEDHRPLGYVRPKCLIAA